MSRFSRVQQAVARAFDMVKTNLGGQLAAALQALHDGRIEDGKELVTWAIDYLDYDAPAEMQRVTEQAAEAEDETQELRDRYGLTEAEIETWVRSGYEFVPMPSRTEIRGAGFSTLSQAMRYARNIPPQYVTGFIEENGFFYVRVSRGD